MGWRGLMLTLLGGALLALPFVLPLFYVLLSMEIIILSLFSLSLNLLVGYTGMVSFGHAAYFALGAYTVGLLVKEVGVAMPWAFLAAPVVAALGAAVFGFFCVRRTHAYFVMLTLAFSQILWAITHKWYGLTGGDNGIIGIWPARWIAAPEHYYYFVLAVAGACTLVLWRLVESPFGYTLQAIRENPQRAEFIGVPVRRYQFIVFVIAGFFAGVAGALFAYFNGSVFPEFAFWIKSAEPLVAVIIGGTYYFWGPVAGSVVFKLLDTLITRYTEHWQIVLGALILLIVLVFPTGVTGFDLQKVWWRRRWNRSRS